MKPATASLYRVVLRFTRGSTAGLLQLLVASAEKKTFRRIIRCPTYPVPARSEGLSLAVGHFLEMMRSPSEHMPTLLARLYSSARSLPERKSTGQFFTAAPVADWALSENSLPLDSHICDAGAGTGVFANAILRRGARVQSYTGIENDAILALCAAHTLEALNAPEYFRIWYANFLLLRKKDFTALGLPLPNVIISNPPFVRSHNLTGRGRLRAALKSSLGITISALAGSGSYFISRAADLAAGAPAPNGDVSKKRMMFFLPQEASGAAHMQRLMHDLRATHGWNWRQLTIPKKQTGVDKNPSNALALLFLFEQTEVRAAPRPPKRREDICLQEVVRVRRGISTGLNDFFVLTDDEVKRRGIPETRLRAVLPTRISIKGDTFSKSDWDHLRQSNHACWLLRLPDGDIESFEPAVQEYLKEGIRRGAHETPTGRSYKTWCSIPIPEAAPDVFVTYMFRGQPRFILNEAGVLHLTNILGGRFVSPIADARRKKIIIESLNTQAKYWVNKHMAGREYKGGLMKIEPRELSHLPINLPILKLFNRRRSGATPRSLFD